MARVALPRGDEKRAWVEEMFDRVAPSYERVNRVISLGQDRKWRRDVVRALALPPASVVLDVACGTGDLCRELGNAKHRPVGVDLSAGMLEVARERAAAAGVAKLVDLRLGDLRTPPVEGRYRLVTSPFRALLHMETDADRRAALHAARSLVADGGRFVFDVFEPGAEDIADTHRRWLEREPGIWERADWDERTRTLILRVRGDDGETEMSLAWLSVPEWEALLGECGFEVEAVHGWFDGQPYRGGEDSVWICTPSVS